MIIVVSRSYFPFERKCGAVWCSFSSSSDGNGSKARNFYESDEDYVNSTVLEAVDVKSSSDGFVIKMHDGRNLSGDAYCAANGCSSSCSDCESYCISSHERYDRKDGIFRCMAQLVCVTKRVHGAYLAQLYLTKVGNEKETINFDLRPSNAINIALRCQVPIQVNRHVTYSDGMRVVESAKMAAWHPPSDGSLFQELDRPSGQPCLEAKEFNLVQNMLIAVVEERYRDAAQWRDKLFQIRSKKKKWA